MTGFHGPLVFLPVARGGVGTYLPWMTDESAETPFIGDHQLPPGIPEMMLPTEATDPEITMQPHQGTYVDGSLTDENLQVELDDGRIFTVTLPQSMRASTLYPALEGGVSKITFDFMEHGEPVMWDGGYFWSADGGPPWGSGFLSDQCCEDQPSGQDCDDPTPGTYCNTLWAIDELFCTVCGSGDVGGGCTCGACKFEVRRVKYLLPVLAKHVSTECVVCSGETGSGNG